MKYHGTTERDLPAINRSGLKKASWCSPDRAVAEHFARDRAAWNGSKPVLLSFDAKTWPVRLDRSGRQECQTKSVVRAFQVSELSLKK